MNTALLNNHALYDQFVVFFFTIFGSKLFILPTTITMGHSSHRLKPHMHHIFQKSKWTVFTLGCISLTLRPYHEVSYPPKRWKNKWAMTIRENDVYKWFPKYRLTSTLHDNDIHGSYRWISYMNHIDLPRICAINYHTAPMVFWFVHKSLQEHLPNAHQSVFEIITHNVHISFVGQ